MTSRVFVRVLLVCALLVGCGTGSMGESGGDRSSFITNGNVDGNAHPAVVMVVMDVGGQPAFRCSGTFIAPKVVLTAGHCAGEPGEFSGVRVFTESDVENGNNNFPFPGPNTTPGSPAASRCSCRTTLRPAAPASATPADRTSSARAT